MNREDIEHMWKVASNNPNHDTNWHDPVVIRFAALVLSERTWVNLTSEEIGEIYRVGWANNMELARAIEAKLKEKNVSTL